MAEGVNVFANGFGPKGLAWVWELAGLGGAEREGGASVLESSEQDRVQLIGDMYDALFVIAMGAQAGPRRGFREGRYEAEERVSDLVALRGDE